MNHPLSTGIARDVCGNEIKNMMTLYVDRNNENANNALTKFWELTDDMEY